MQACTGELIKASAGLKVSYRENPFSQRAVVCDVEEGRTLEEIARALEADLHHLRIYINGEPIPREWWSRVRPRVAARVHFYTIPEGGEGKSTGRLLASIAVVVAASAVAGPAGTAIAGPGIAGAVAGSLVATGITLIGSLAVNALFPVANVNSSSGDTGDAQLSIQAPRNRFPTYQPMLRVYGRHRVFPYYAAQPYTEIRGNDTYLFLLFDFGYGPLNLKAHKIGETPLSDYKGVKMRVHRRLTDGSALRIYTKDVFQEAHNILLEKDSPVLLTTQANVTTIAVDIYSLGLFQIKDTQPAQATQKIKIEYRVAGTNNAWSTFNSGDFWFSDPDRMTTEVQSVVQVASQPDALDLVVRREQQDIRRYDFYYGVAEGSTTIPISGTSGARAGDRLEFSDGQTYAILGTSGSNIIIAEPLQFEIITEIVTLRASGGSRPNEPGPTGETKAARLYQDRDGIVYFRGRETRPFSYSINFEVPGPEQFEVRITRQNEARNKEGEVDEPYISSLKSVAAFAPVNFRVPHTVVEMRIRATKQLNGTIDTYSATATSVLPKWDRVTGQWTEGATRNPAWIIVDAMCGTVNRRPMNRDTRLDLESFADFAEHCAAPAANTGNQSFRCDHLLTGNMTVRQFISDVASAGRATLTAVDGKYVMVPEQAQTVPVQIFTPKNSWGFSAVQNYIDQPHALDVRFVDPQSNWQERVFRVFSDGYDETNATVFEDLNLFGVTREEQAWRDGRYHLAQGLLRPEEVIFFADIENLVCFRGALVEVVNDIMKMGGPVDRVVTVTYDGGTQNVDEMTVDELVVMDGGTTYHARVRLANGDFVEGELVNPPPDANTLKFVTPIPGPQRGDLVTWAEVDKLVGEYLVKTIRPGPDLSARITCTNYNDAIYLADQGPIPPYVPLLTNDPGGFPPAAVEGLRVEQRIEYQDARPVLSATITWDMPVNQNWQSFGVYQGVDSDAVLSLLAYVQTNQYIFLEDIDILSNRGILGSTYTFAIVALGALGQQLPIELASQITFTPSLDQGRPTLPQSFTGQVLTETLELSWIPPSDPAVAGYRIKFNPLIGLGVTWATSITLKTATRGQTTTSVNARVGSYLIKSFDVYGNESADFGLVVTSIPQLRNLNVIERLNDRPLGWPGAFDNMEVIGQNIRLPEQPPASGTYAQRGTYTMQQTVDLGDVFTSRCTAVIQAHGTREEGYMDNWPVLSQLESLSAGVTDLNWSAYTEVRGADSITTMSEWGFLSSLSSMSAGTVEAKDWRRLTIADQTARLLNFRVVAETTDPTVTVTVTRFAVEVDMPDRTDSGDDFIAPVGGLDVQFDTPFKVPPAVVITMDDARSGDGYRFLSKTREGFTVQFVDRNNASVQRQFDWLAKGYGFRADRTI